ncbi:hypothetical protein BC628DRAFT_352139 [Trametes gibbosa]|nr:hypothetical protein BC628DRAFT_352139 [Trametes gibbosa]
MVTIHISGVLLEQWLVYFASLRFIPEPWRTAIIAAIILCLICAILTYLPPYAAAVARLRSAVERGQRLAKELEELLEQTHRIAAASHGALADAIQLVKAKETENGQLRRKLARSGRECARARAERQRRAIDDEALRTLHIERTAAFAQREAAVAQCDASLEKMRRELEEARRLLAERDAALVCEKERNEELEGRWEEMRERLREAVEDTSELFTGTLCNEWADY